MLCFARSRHRNILPCLPRRLLALLGLLGVIPWQPLAADEPRDADLKPPRQEQQAVSSPRRAERLAAMQKIAAVMTVEAVEDGKKRKVELVDGARFRFSNPVGPCYDATVWVWGRSGRPAALLTLSAERLGRDNPSYWAYELTSISPLELAVASPDGWKWTPEAAGLSCKPVPDAPTPADQERVRQRQMKDIVRRFDAYGVYPGGRVDLRALPTPIHTYSDAAAGILGGALFFIADGTNPEVLLAIEAASPEGMPPQFNFAINRVSAAELHARLDGKEIWTSPPVATNPKIRSPYFLFHRPMVRELGDE